MDKFEYWTSADLYMERQDLRLLPTPDWFRQNFFSSTPHLSKTQEILISELPTPYRVMAPFVMPSSQGKPIFKRRGETVKSVTPPYIKPKDAVRPQEAANVLPSQIFRNGGLPTVQERFDQRVQEVIQFHLRAIDMTIAWLCARAVIDGKYTITYAADQGQAHPEVTVDFGRDPGHTITLSTDHWDDPSADIIGDLTTWSNLVYKAKFGGRPNRVIVGADVVPCFQNNTAIKELLSTQIRGGEGTTIQRGMLNIDEPLTYVMTLGGIGQSLEIWTYKDVVEAPNGDMVDILDPRDILMLAPGNQGVIAYGAIWDADAMMADAVSVDVFPKMWTEKDPGEVYVMHQSSPLPFVLYPNRTLKARVLA